jgi:nucleoid-associated protein YgaU
VLGAPTTGPAPVLPAHLDWPGLVGGASVVVQPGDTLWGLAAQSLHQSGAAPPSDAEVARAWPTWWSANREVIGDDPHLLFPGTVLTSPDQGP